MCDHYLSGLLGQRRDGLAQDPAKSGAVLGSCATTRFVCEATGKRGVASPSPNLVSETPTRNRVQPCQSCFPRWLRLPESRHRSHKNLLSELVGLVAIPDTAQDEPMDRLVVPPKSRLGKRVHNK